MNQADDSAHAALKSLQARAESLALPTLRVELPQGYKLAIGDLRRSDHSSFWVENYPAIMLGDTANFRNPHYHCAKGPDEVEDLDLDFARKITAATVGAVAE